MAEAIPIEQAQNVEKVENERFDSNPVVENPFHLFCQACFFWFSTGVLSGDFSVIDCKNLNLSRENRTLESFSD